MDDFSADYDAAGAGFHVCLFWRVAGCGTRVERAAGVAPIYWVVCTIEVFTYAPMLGSGGTYLAFVTGNITNLKAPAAINAMQMADVKAGSEKGEVVSTIAIATTSIITTIILALGVLLLRRWLLF